MYLRRKGCFISVLLGFREFPEGERRGLSGATLKRMEEEVLKEKEMDVEEKVQEEALSLLLQGKFQDCFLLCQRFFNARPSDARSNLLPDVDFEADSDSNASLNP